MRKAECPPNAPQYNGEWWDAAGGRYHFRARDYDPSSGRFTQRDTYVPGVGDLSDRNVYAFVGADPVNHTDPTGMWTTTQALTVTAIGSVIGGIGLMSAGVFGPIGRPSLGWSLVPVVGSMWNAAYNFQQGNIGWGAFYAAVAVSDVFLAKTIVTGSINLMLRAPAIGSASLAGEAIAVGNNVGWKTLPGGVRIVKSGSVYIKEVAPEASGFSRWWALTSLEAQARALKSLGSMAPEFYYSSGRLVIKDAGRFNGSISEFLKIRAAATIRTAEVFNDVWPRNIGVAGKVFDPALQPLAAVAWATAPYLLWRIFSSNMDTAAEDN